MRIPIPTKNLLRNSGFLIFLTLLILIYIFGYSTDLSRKLNHILDIQTDSDNLIPSKPNNLAKVLHQSVYNFIKDPNLMKTIIEERDVVSKSNLDLLLNIRKLTLFATREFNKLEGCDLTQTTATRKSACKNYKWTNPLKIIILKTYAYSGYKEHDVIFPIEHGNIPFYVRIRQIDLTLSNVLHVANELVIQGNFYKLDGNSKKLTPVVQQIYTEDNPGPDDDAQLYSWKINQSYFVADYIPINDSKSYLIQPRGGKGNFNGSDPYCDPTLRMLVVIISEPLNFKNRQRIRETYASPSKLGEKKVKVLFLLGRFPNKKLQELVRKESATYGDIIQGSFIAAYHNLTLAHLSIYDWVTTRCKQRGMMPSHILKSSDDLFINIDLMLKVAQGNPHSELIGSPNCGNPPSRQISFISTYYTPRYMYTPKVYPGYMSGSGMPYLIRSDVIRKLLKVALTTPIIHMDDIYVTGLLPRQLNLVPRHSALFKLVACQMDPCELQKETSCIVGKNVNMMDVWTEYNKPCPALPTLNIYVEETINPHCLY